LLALLTLVTIFAKATTSNLYYTKFTIYNEDSLNQGGSYIDYKTSMVKGSDAETSNMIVTIPTMSTGDILMYKNGAPIRITASNSWDYGVSSVCGYFKGEDYRSEGLLAFTSGSSSSSKPKFIRYKIYCDAANICNAQRQGDIDLSYQVSGMAYSNGVFYFAFINDEIVTADGAKSGLTFRSIRSDTLQMTRSVDIPLLANSLLARIIVVSSIDGLLLGCQNYFASISQSTLQPIEITTLDDSITAKGSIAIYTLDNINLNSNLYLANTYRLFKVSTISPKWQYVNDLYRYQSAIESTYTNTMNIIGVVNMGTHQYLGVFMSTSSTRECTVNFVQKNNLKANSQYVTPQYYQFSTLFQYPNNLYDIGPALGISDFARSEASKNKYFFSMMFYSKIFYIQAELPEPIESQVKYFPNGIGKADDGRIGTCNSPGCSNCEDSTSICKSCKVNWSLVSSKRTCEAMFRLAKVKRRYREGAIDYQFNIGLNFNQLLSNVKDLKVDLYGYNPESKLISSRILAGDFQTPLKKYSLNLLDNFTLHEISNGFKIILKLNDSYPDGFLNITKTSLAAAPLVSNLDDSSGSIYPFEDYPITVSQIGFLNLDGWLQDMILSLAIAFSIVRLLATILLSGPRPTASIVLDRLISNFVFLYLMGNQNNLYSQVALKELVDQKLYGISVQNPFDSWIFKGRCSMPDSSLSEKELICSIISNYPFGLLIIGGFLIINIVVKLVDALMFRKSIRSPNDPQANEPSPSAGIVDPESDIRNQVNHTIHVERVSDGAIDSNCPRLISVYGLRFSLIRLEGLQLELMIYGFLTIYTANDSVQSAIGTVISCLLIFAYIAHWIFGFILSREIWNRVMKLRATKCKNTFPLRLEHGIDLSKRYGGYCEFLFADLKFPARYIELLFPLAGIIRSASLATIVIFLSSYTWLQPRLAVVIEGLYLSLVLITRPKVSYYEQALDIINPLVIIIYVLALPDYNSQSNYSSNGPDGINIFLMVLVLLPVALNLFYTIGAILRFMFSFCFRSLRKNRLMKIVRTHQSLQSRTEVLEQTNDVEPIIITEPQHTAIEMMASPEQPVSPHLRHSPVSNREHTPNSRRSSIQNDGYRNQTSPQSPINNTSSAMDTSLNFAGNRVHSRAYRPPMAIPEEEDVLQAQMPGEIPETTPIHQPPEITNIMLKPSINQPENVSFTEDVSERPRNINALQNNDLSPVPTVNPPEVREEMETNRQVKTDSSVRAEEEPQGQTQVQKEDNQNKEKELAKVNVNPKPAPGRIVPLSPTEIAWMELQEQTRLQRQREQEAANKESNKIGDT